MKISRYSSAAELLEKSGLWLEQSEAENNVILGVARRSEDYDLANCPPTYWASVDSEGEIVGCAFRTPPFAIGLTSMPLEAIPLLVEDASEVYKHAPGVNGPFTEAEEFAKAWSTRHETTWRVHTNLKIHRLTKVNVPRNAAQGELRRPLGSETSLIRKWAAGFVEDTGVPDDPDEVANRLIESGKTFIWDNQGPRCMLAGARETPNGVCINSVYTPAENRRSGYATIAVATFSQQQLDAGKKFCCLYTDSDNPTSNSIYGRIGYVPIRDDVHIDFIDGDRLN